MTVELQVAMERLERYLRDKPPYGYRDAGLDIRTVLDALEARTEALRAEIAALSHVAFCTVRGVACPKCEEAEATDWNVARAALGEEP